MSYKLIRYLYTLLNNNSYYRIILRKNNQETESNMRQQNL